MATQAIATQEAQETVTINLPFFPGFYEAILSGILDSAVEREAENMVEKEESQTYYPETYFPEALRLDHSDLWEHVSYSDAYREIAKDYCEVFDQWMNDNLETPLGSFTFESMDSPREYNFTTDRVYVTCPIAVIDSLYAGIDIAKLQAAIAARHTSRSGFISFYPDDLETWQDKIRDGLAGLDHNELGTILSAAIAPHVDNARDWQWELCESLAEYDYQYLDSHMDWQSYETACQQARADKLAALIVADMDEAARLVVGCDRIAALESMALESDAMDDESRIDWQGKEEPRAYRCPFTVDMFSGEGESV